MLAAAIRLLVVLLMTAGVARAAWERATDRAREDFDATAAQLRGSVDRELQRYFDELGDVGAAVVANPALSPEQMQAYVDGTGIFEQLQPIVGIIVLHRVESSEVDEFTARLRATSMPDFEVIRIGETPPGGPEYILTYYVPGELDLEFPIGTDVSPIPSIFATLESGFARGDGAAGSFQNDPLLEPLAAETGFSALDRLLSVDFFIGVPVFAPGDPSDRVPLAWVAAPVDRFDRVLESALDGQPTDLGTRLSVDLEGVSGGDESITRLAERQGSAGPPGSGSFQVDQRFNVGGVDWRLEVWSGPGANDAAREVVALVLAAGVAASLLVAAVVYLRGRSRAREQAFRARERAYAAELEAREQFQRDILESVDEAVVVLDGDARIVSANRAWEELRRASATGAGSGRDEGRAYAEVMVEISPASTTSICQALERVLGPHPQLVEMDVAIDDARRGRSWKAMRMAPLLGSSGGAVVVHTDITERKRSQDDLRLRATRDTLTGLLNRMAFEEELGRALRRARRERRALGLIFVDLDGFKPINDTFGHSAGDDVLRAVAQRVTGAVRAGDRVGRLGGDEFVVLLGDLGGPQEAEVTAQRILDALSHPVHVEGRTIPVAASAGVAVLEDPEGDAASVLLDLADKAMYTAKQQGGARYVLAP